MSAGLYLDDSASSEIIRRKKRAILLVALLLVSVPLALLLVRNHETFPSIPADLRLQGIDGTTAQWSSFRGKPLIVKFWATSCVICMQQLAGWKQFYRASDAGNEFEIISLAMYHDRPDDVIEVSRQRDLPYPVFLDLLKQAAQAFGNVLATPTTFLVDRDGTVVKRYLGRVDFEQLALDLQQVS